MIHKIGGSLLLFAVNNMVIIEKFLLCLAVFICSFNAHSMEVSHGVDESTSASSSGWAELIKATRSADYQRVRALIVDHYYPILTVGELNALNDLPEKQQFLEALASSGLSVRVQRELNQMVKEGLIRDLARITEIGEKIRTHKVEHIGNVDGKRLVIFPDIHANVDLEVSTIATIFNFWREGDLLLTEGSPDSEGPTTDLGWLSGRAIKILAHQKTKAIFGTYLPLEAMLFFQSIARLMYSSKYLSENPFEERDNLLHLKNLPYRNIRTTGWDIDLGEQLVALRRIGQDLDDETVGQRNPFLIRTVEKYLGQNEGRVLMMAGADHIPETALHARLLRRNAILRGEFDDDDKAAMLANFDLKTLPSTVSEALEQVSSWPKDIQALRETHEFLRRTPHILVISPEFMRALAMESEHGVIAFKSEIDKALQEPGIFAKLFEEAKKGDYDEIKRIFAKFYYPLFIGNAGAYEQHISAFAFLLYKQSLFERWKKEFAGLVLECLDADSAFIKQVGNDISLKNAASLGLAQTVDLVSIFRFLGVNYSGQQDVRIHFLPQNSMSYRESLANFLFVNRLAGERDAIFFERPMEGGASLEGVAMESILLLRILALKKCEEVGIQCHARDLELLVDKLCLVMRNHVNMHPPLMKLGSSRQNWQFIDLPPRRLTFGHFGGPVNARDFSQQNDELLMLMQRAFSMGVENIWILTSPERIGAYSLLRYELVKEIVAEEGIDVSQHAGALDNHLDLDAIFAREDLDPLALWLPMLPHDFCQRLGGNNYRMYYQKAFLNRNKSQIRANVQKWQRTLKDNERVSE